MSKGHEESRGKKVFDTFDFVSVQLELCLAGTSPTTRKVQKVSACSLNAGLLFYA